MNQQQRYFLTVSWCDGTRGIFCNTKGVAFTKLGEPHTEADMIGILGPFRIILSPQSEPFTEKQMTEYTRFRPLEEYTNEYGIAYKPEPANQEVAMPEQEEVGLDEAYSMGYDAYGRGVGEDQNPFAATNERYSEWADGWTDCQKAEGEG